MVTDKATENRKVFIFQQQCWVLEAKNSKFSKRISFNLELKYIQTHKSAKFLSLILPFSGSY